MLLGDRLLDLFSHLAEVVRLDPLDQVELEGLLLADYLDVLPLGLFLLLLLLNRRLGCPLLEADAASAYAPSLRRFRLACFLQASSCDLVFQLLPLLHDFHFLLLQVYPLPFQIEFLLLVLQLFLLPLLGSKFLPDLLLLLRYFHLDALQGVVAAF